MSDNPIRVELTWPDKALWPNGGHNHHMKVHRFKKAARTEANWATRFAMQRHLYEHDGNPIAIHVVAHPKTTNAVDAQNLIAGLKAHFDGIADALGVDDKYFAAPTVAFAEPMTNGRVIVEVAR